MEQVRITVFGKDLFYDMGSQFHHYLKFHDRTLKHSVQSLTSMLNDERVGIKNCASSGEHNDTPNNKI